MKPLYLLPLLLLATPALAQGAPQAPSPEETQAQALIDNGRLEMALGQTAKQLISAQKQIKDLQAQLAKKAGDSAPKK